MNNDDEVKKLKTKSVAIFVLVFILLLLGGGFYAYANYYKPKMEARQKIQAEEQRKTDFQNRFNEFSNMISVGLCQESYDEFITSGSKERRGDNFFAHCNFRKEQWGDIKVETTVFSSDNKRADAKFTYSYTFADTDSQKFKDCYFGSSSSILRLTSSYETCKTLAPKKTEVKDTVETWLFEGNKWMRDY